LLTIYGAQAGDMAGTETYIADFNADGYDDLLVSAQNHDGPGGVRVNAGAAYVIFGAADMAGRDDIDLQAPPPGVLTILGDNDGDHFGVWVEGGDFDGDGIQDMLIGANQADGLEESLINAGEAWIFYGAEDMDAAYGPLIDLRDPPASATRLIGADYDDLFGSTVYGADMDGDGIDDAIISAALWRGSAGVGGLSFGGGDGPGNTRYNAGETVVIFGDASLRGATLQLAELINAEGRPADNRLTVVYGAGPNDLLGEEITVGDLNGDGRADLVLGTLVGFGPGDVSEEAGEAWVIYTTAFFRGQMFDLANPPNSSVVIYPDQPFSKGGDTMRVADIDGDGIGDLLYGAPDYDPTGYDGLVRRNAGLLAVIYGQTGGLAHDDGVILLPSAQPEGLRVQYLIGADHNDMLAYSMAVYDMDGDGVQDIIPNAMGGDGAYNSLTNAGEIYVINGAAFAGVDPQTVIAQAAPTAVMEAAPTATPAPLTIDTSTPGDPDEGRRLYRLACAGCHGLGADGEGVGVSLRDTPYMAATSAEELLRFLQVGRESDDPANSTGINMPAYGGRPDWGDGELWDVVAYLRLLNGQD
ncbi:MAG: cytochrome c, partial [Anaerolineae bacterium]|nr:cytochrome c [Anaerolineae bacterium]